MVGCTRGYVGWTCFVVLFSGPIMVVAPISLSTSTTTAVRHFRCAAVVHGLVDRFVAVTIVLRSAVLL